YILPTMPKNSKRKSNKSKKTETSKTPAPSKTSEVPSPEFDLSNPLASFFSVLRAVVFSPRRFFTNFETDGPMREPAIFAFLVGVAGGILSLITAPILAFFFGSEVNISQGVSFGLSPLAAVGFAVLSPALVAIMATVYLVAIRTFIGGDGDFRRIFRMSAYAYGAMFLAPMPIIGAFAVTFSLMIVMGVGVHVIYRSAFMTTLITALTGFVPIALILVALRGLAA
ncbi:MAG: YIP1 family protein, partial [Rubrobacteraceae bacterium]